MEESVSELVPELTTLAKDKMIQELEISTTQAYVYRMSKWNEEPVSVSISGTYDPSHSEARDQFSADANKLLEGKEIVGEIEVVPKLKGNKFPTLAKVKQVINPDAAEEDVGPLPGEVTLFDFWATWCGPCQGPMKHNQEMLEKHPEWAGKAKIVGISLDNTIDAPRTRVTEKGWTKVSHYWVSGGWSSNACKAFGISGIPFCVLVDKAGVIQLTGHPNSMDLENNIQLLIKDGTIAGASKEPDAQLKDASYTYAACKTELEEFVKSHEPELKAVTNPLVGSVFKKSAKDGKLVLAGAFLVVRFAWPKKKKDLADKLKADINKSFGAKITIKLQDQEIPLYKIEFGQKCEKCGHVLGKCDQYLCTICQPSVYLCTECVEKCKNPTKMEDLPHPHPLYFIQKESEPVLEELRWGNLKMGKGSISDKGHHCSCDCCSTTPHGLRWKCAVCADVDVCETCFEANKNPSHEKYEELNKNAQAAGHNMKTHVYIRQEFKGFADIPG